jgi:uncharacterized membrane protein YeaQ/YmgE (transglycosylase-associated protein family)
VNPYFLIIGATAGWLAGVIVKGYGFGLLRSNWNCPGRT